MGGKGGSAPAPPPQPVDNTKATEEFMNLMLPMFEKMTEMISAIATAPLPEPPMMPPALQMPTVEPYVPVDWEAEYKKMQEQANKNIQDDLARRNTQDKTILTSPLLAQSAEEMKSLLGESLKQQSGQNTS